MKHLRLVSLAVLSAIVCLVSAAVGAEIASPSTLQKGLVSGNSDFAVHLYHQLSPTPGNLFYSPYSVSSAMGMTYAGARESTAKEIRDVMRFRFDQTQLNGAFKSLNKDIIALSGKGGQKLNIANGLCLTGGDVSKQYKTILKEDYGAEIFAGDLEKINGWVKQQTQGKIDKILEHLDTNSVCVILNAIYFKGIWESQFSKIHTSDAPFAVSSTKKVSAPLMYQKNEFKLLNEKGFQALSIPYKGKSLSMVVFLPDTIDGMDALEKQLTLENLAGWLEKLDQQPMQKVDLFLPRFKFESSYDLVSPFQKMGMKEAFGAGADFIGMGWKKGDLWISQIKHKAVVEVNEEGTEAAAATAVEMATKAMRYEPVFRADHPFLFLIRENLKGTILFMGRMADPTGK
jgi:serpin B